VRHAIFTIVQDEPSFFPLWYNYYSRHYKSRHIYVLYHPLPGEVDQPSWLRVPVYSDTNIVHVAREKSFDHTWLREQAERFAAFLLGSYTTVTFAEADEIITPDPAGPAGPDLAAWLDGWGGRHAPAACCTGYEVVHRFDVEPAVDPDEFRRSRSRVLRDRGWWYPSEIYSKVLTWRVPPRWGNGFHQAYINRGPDHSPAFGAFDPRREPDLLLLHLHKVDYPTAVSRLRRTAARDWPAADTRGRIGIQNRFLDEDQLKAWWYQSIDDPAARAELVPMPAAVRGII
jgi:hypothetical protein